jgi:hypothetical protein
MPNTAQKKPDLDFHLMLTDTDDGKAIMIRPDGTDVHHGEKGFPVIVEWRRGIPYLMVWADIMQEDATHIINLENALVEPRTEMGKLMRKPGGIKVCLTPVKKALEVTDGAFNVAEVLGGVSDGLLDDAATDLIADVLHVAAARGIEPDVLADEALRHFEAERANHPGN